MKIAKLLIAAAFGLVAMATLSYADQLLAVPDNLDNKDHSIVKATLYDDGSVGVICSKAFANSDETARYINCTLLRVCYAQMLDKDSETLTFGVYDRKGKIVYYKKGHAPTPPPTLGDYYNAFKGEDPNK